MTGLSDLAIRSSSGQSVQVATRDLDEIVAVLFDPVDRDLVPGRADGDEAACVDRVLDASCTRPSESRVSEKRLTNFRSLRFSVVGMDERVDVAVLQLDGEGEGKVLGDFAHGSTMRRPCSTLPMWLFAISKMNKRSDRECLSCAGTNVVWDRVGGHWVDHSQRLLTSRGARAGPGTSSHSFQGAACRFHRSFRC